MKHYQCIDIIKQYINKYVFIETDDEQSFWARERLHRIGIPKRAFYSEHPDDMFRLLHEIGHCEIFDGRFNQATKEFKATQWAISHCKQYNIDVSQEHQQIWQDYIYSFTKAKDKTKYKLDWSPMN